MKTIQQLLPLLCIAFFCFSCGDDPVEEMLPTQCYPNKIIEVVDDTTSLTLMELDYDAENQIKTAFIHEHFTEWTLIHKTAFTYDSSNKLLSATNTTEGIANKKTEYEYVYDGEQVVQINAVTDFSGFETIVNTSITYTEDGLIDAVHILTDSMSVVNYSGGNDVHGNQISWTNFGVSGRNTLGPGSNPIGNFSIEFDANHKGPFADLDYNMAVAHRYTTGSAIMLTKHALQRQIFAIIVTGNNTQVLDRYFTNSKFNDLNYQTEALDDSGFGYIFEYDCQ